MSYLPFDRSYYPRQGGSGFGGNAWVSLMGGAAQGLLAAQKNRAELIKQAQEEALRRAAEQRAIDSSQRERERLEMARKEQEEASKARMKAEEDRVEAQRKAREEEARQRDLSAKILEGWRADPEMAKYYTDAELEAMAPSVAAGGKPPRPPKPTGGSDLNFYANPVEERRLGAQEFLQKWDTTHLGQQVGQNTLPPSQGNVLFGPDNKPITDPRQAYEQVLVPQLRRVIAEMQQVIATSEPGSSKWYEARRNMEEAAAVLSEIERRTKETSGDFASGGFDFSGVSTSAGR